MGCEPWPVCYFKHCFFSLTLYFVYMLKKSMKSWSLGLSYFRGLMFNITDSSVVLRSRLSLLDLQDFVVIDDAYVIRSSSNNGLCWASSGFFMAFSRLFRKTMAFSVLSVVPSKMVFVIFVVPFLSNSSSPKFTSRG